MQILMSIFELFVCCIVIKSFIFLIKKTNDVVSCMGGYYRIFLFWVKLWLKYLKLRLCDKFCKFVCKYFLFEKLGWIFLRGRVCNHFRLVSCKLQVGDRQWRLWNQSSPQMGPLFLKDVGRIAKHIKKEGKMKRVRRESQRERLAIHGAMGWGKKSFILVWRCHLLLSGFLANGHLLLVVGTSVS